jgi:hypothetical protein
MKFPKSVHAEGWLDHIERTAPDHMPEALSGTAPQSARKPVGPTAAAPRAEPVRHERIVTPAVPPTPVAAASGYSAPPSSSAAAPRQSGMAPWLIGAGACAVLIAGVVMLSGNFSPESRQDLPPRTVVGEVSEPLPAEPSAAVPTTPAPESVAAATPEPTPAATPAASPTERTAAASPNPAAQEGPRVIAQAPTPQAQTAAPSPALQPLPAAPVVKTLTPPAETQSLAQAPTPPVTLRDATPAAPVTPQAAELPVSPPVATAPEAPSALPPAAPLAQAQPQTDPQAPQPTSPEDTGITLKVRTALASDALLAAVPIAVSTDHGVVKLEGQAPDPAARERATLVASTTQGVKSVDNRLTLPPVAQFEQLAPQLARAPGG